MEKSDIPRFFQALNSLGVMFCDELSKDRQQLYWTAMRVDVSIEEWEYACMQAIQCETFHKVPLPAILWTYIETFRQEQACRQEQEHFRQVEAAYMVQNAQRIALESSPEWQAEQQALRLAREQERIHEREEARQRDQEYQDWKSSLSKEDLRLFNFLNLPSEPYTWPGIARAEEQLYFQPRGDPAEAKRKARKQLSQIMSEMKGEKEEW